MERISRDPAREATLALRSQIQEGLGRLDPSVVALIRLEFLLELAEVIKDRKLGLWRAPSALETAAMSVRSQGLAGAIESARPLAKDEEIRTGEELRNLPVPVTYWRTVLFVLESVRQNDQSAVPEETPRRTSHL